MIEAIQCVQDDCNTSELSSLEKVIKNNGMFCIDAVHYSLQHLSTDLIFYCKSHPIMGWYQFIENNDQLITH